MKTTSAFTDILSGLAYGVAALALVSLIIQHQLFVSNAAVVVVQVGAALLMLWARIEFGRRSFHVTASATEGVLVQSGPFRFVRHPIYAAVLYFAWAGQIQSPTIASLVAATVLTVALGVRIVLEERSLIATYPEYAAYAKKVKRVLPFVI